jgi:Arc/MetJ family transcription regulator
MAAILYPIAIPIHSAFQDPDTRFEHKRTVDNTPPSENNVYGFREAFMKRTNIVLDPDLARRAKALTGIKTMRGLVDHALHELVRRRRQRDLMTLRGRIRWESDLDSLRRGRSGR